MAPRATTRLDGPMRLCRLRPAGSVTARSSAVPRPRGRNQERREVVCSRRRPSARPSTGCTGPSFVGRHALDAAAPTRARPGAAGSPGPPSPAAVGLPSPGPPEDLARAAGGRPCARRAPRPRRDSPRREAQGLLGLEVALRVVEAQLAGSPAPASVRISAEGRKSASRRRASSAGSPVSMSRGARPAGDASGPSPPAGPCASAKREQLPGHEARAPVREGDRHVALCDFDASLAALLLVGDRPRAGAAGRRAAGRRRSERRRGARAAWATGPRSASGAGRRGAGGGAETEAGRRSGPAATARRRGGDGVLPSMIFLRDGVVAARGGTDGSGGGARTARTAPAPGPVAHDRLLGVDAAARAGTGRSRRGAGAASLGRRQRAGGGARAADAGRRRGRRGVGGGLDTHARPPLVCARRDLALGDQHQVEAGRRALEPRRKLSRRRRLARLRAPRRPPCRLTVRPRRSWPCVVRERPPGGRGGRRGAIPCRKTRRNSAPPELMPLGVAQPRAGRRRHSGQAPIRLRPFWRRRLRTSRPPLVRMRTRKPWVLFRLRLLGWNVRFMTGRLGPADPGTPMGARLPWTKVQVYDPSALSCQSRRPPGRALGPCLRRVPCGNFAGLAADDSCQPFRGSRNRLFHRC